MINSQYRVGNDAPKWLPLEIWNKARKNQTGSHKDNNLILKRLYIPYNISERPKIFLNHTNDLKKEFRIKNYKRLKRLKAVICRCRTSLLVLLWTDSKTPNWTKILLCHFFKNNLHCNLLQSLDDPAKRSFNSIHPFCYNCYCNLGKTFW